jgi:hypothetical protein
VALGVKLPNVAVFNEMKPAESEGDLVTNQMGSAELARATGAHVSTVKRWKAGARPGRRYERRLRHLHHQ